MTDRRAGAGIDAPAALFTLDDVSLEVEGRRVLDHVDLTVGDRGITVIVGPSGGGKTTLLRLLNRLEVPTSGVVRFRGDPLDELDPLALRRRVGMVFQRPAPFPGTVRDNLLVADPQADDTRLTAALDDAGLGESFLDRSADDLSGGETQRLCLARTLVTEPEVLLMDEPTSALDRASSEHLEDTARRLADGGRPVLWVTHDLEQADRLADDLVVLIDGHVAGAEERDRYLAAARSEAGPGGRGSNGHGRHGPEADGGSGADGGSDRDGAAAPDRDGDDQGSPARG
ncbi:MAG TPA: ATP-binding cassette domain-containing protein [Acidimicrobiales bacterium]